VLLLLLSSSSSFFLFFFKNKKTKKFTQCRLINGTFCFQDIPGGGAPPFRQPRREADFVEAGVMPLSGLDQHSVYTTSPLQEDSHRRP